MAKTGFRIDVRKLRSKANKLAGVRADEFYDEVMEFTRNSLNAAQRLTPTRNYSVIKENQSKQYDLYVNCIPDSHRLLDPSLRINGRKHWLFFRGKWLNASDWRLSADAFDAYQSLLNEHNRRATTSKSAFIAGRAQARFLYRKTWSEAADSLGLKIATSNSVTNAVSRRKPRLNPPRAYGQTRGGGTAFSVTISTPFLTMQPRSKYQTFEAGDIMRAAHAAHLQQFQRSIQKRIRQLKQTA